jgi:chromosome segregation ATPase
MKTVEELEARLEVATGERDEARAEVERLTDERDELLVRVANQDAELRATRDAYNGARTDVPALIAQVRELEAECAALRREIAALMDDH